MTFEKNETEKSMKYHTLGQRHVQAVLMFFGMVLGYFLRVNISAAIVPLTSKTSKANDKSYDWDTSTKSLILSSFFWGYVVAQLPSGLLAKKFGAKIVLGIATLIASAIAILHPIAIAIGDWKLLVTLRVLTGLTQGVVYPCMHTLLAKWVPCTERGFLPTFVYSGGQLGATIMFGTSGKIFSSMGWPGIFYISGCIALMWSIIFLCFGANEPLESRYITKSERDYIERLTGSTTVGNVQLPVPWKALSTSLPFIGLIAAQCGFSWGFYTLLTELPTYMSHVLQLDVKSNALLSALPYFAMWILCLVISPISDTLINRNILSVGTSRKLFNSIGLWIPMVCLIALGYMTKEQSILAITLLTIAVGFNAACFCGYLVNHMDLSPNFSGPMMGISNGISNLCSIIAPLIVGLIVENEEDSTEWRSVFFITAAVYLISNSLFVLFGKGTVQAWNEPTIPPNRISLNNQSIKESIDMSSKARIIMSAIDVTRLS